MTQFWQSYFGRQVRSQHVTLEICNKWGIRGELGVRYWCHLNQGDVTSKMLVSDLKSDEI